MISWFDAKLIKHRDKFTFHLTPSCSISSVYTEKFGVDLMVQTYSKGGDSVFESRFDHVAIMTDFTLAFFSPSGQIPGYT
jgi:hypothetical protein